ncbi:uncharacterized protein LOC111326314 [Stylophora pistillata]|uniref:uncharacterized protein LOC111326314 n=1 Tax=Stylophora pistillata TaxID=50429 RepID=UPI000C04643B|nr:uncharacterized protein LOC111326314 [Stylophora pistillata]
MMYLLLTWIKCFHQIARGKTIFSIFLGALLFNETAGSNTLEGEKYTCATKNVNFECEAAKRVPVASNRGTSYRIKDLSANKEIEIYCCRNNCTVTKNELYGRVQVLETNPMRMTFQMLNLNEFLRLYCHVHTTSEYHSTESHTSDITTVECIRSCIGQDAYLSCQSFQQFLQTPHSLGAFLKKLGGLDISFCDDKGNCACMEECGEYKGRLQPGYKSVNMTNIKEEDAEEDFMFHFEHKDPGKQKLRKCIFKIDAVVCSGPPTGTLEVTRRSPEENKSIEKAHNDTPGTRTRAPEVVIGRSLPENASDVTQQPPNILHNVTSGTFKVTKTLVVLCLVLVISTFPG